MTCRITSTFFFVLGAVIAVASASAVKDHPTSHEHAERKKVCHMEYKKCCFEYGTCGYKFKKVKQYKKVCAYKPQKVPKKVCAKVPAYEPKESDYDHDLTGYEQEHDFEHPGNYETVCKTDYEVKKVKVCLNQIYYKVYKYAKYCAKLSCEKEQYMGVHKKPESKVSKQGELVQVIKGEQAYGKEKHGEHEHVEAKHAEKKHREGKHGETKNIEGKYGGKKHTKGKHCEMKHGEDKHREAKNAEAKHSKGEHGEKKHRKTKHSEAKYGEKKHILTLLLLCVLLVPAVRNNLNNILDYFL